MVVVTRRTPAAAALFVFLMAAPALADGGGIREEGKGLPPSDVVRIMSSRRTQIRKLCYEQNPAKAEASMKIDFVVSMNGIVLEAKPRDASGPEAIASCVVAEVKKTIFPESGTGGRFVWPFIFKGP
jgi:hypothetical protein